MTITIETVTKIRKRLHCSIRRATHVAKREQMLDMLERTCERGNIVDFAEFMTEIIQELYKD